MSIKAQIKYKYIESLKYLYFNGWVWSKNRSMYISFNSVNNYVNSKNTLKVLV